MAVTINPGDDIAAAIAANPDGTVFNLAAGTHRLTAGVTLKTDQSFIGVIGTPGVNLTSIVSGARLLTSWTVDGSNWKKAGQTQAGTVNGSVGDGTCLASNPRCGYPEDLFIDNVIKTHVATLGAVGPGKWFFDYAADTIYIGDDPTGKTVETSLSPSLAEGYTTGATFKYLIIEKFATPTGAGPINILGYLTDMGLEVSYCEVRYNHFGGLPCNGTSWVHHNYSHHNGALNAIGSGPANLIELNELSYAGISGYNPYFGVGGSKWVFSDGLIVRQNWSHHNAGVGLWTDINNQNTTYDNNLIEDNDYTGLFHEISYACVIKNNRIYRNGLAHTFPGYVDGAGILVSCAKNVEVYGNLLIDNWQGICGLEDHRGSGTIEDYALLNLNVHNNTTTFNLATLGGYRSGVYDTSGSAAWGVPANNHYTANTYIFTGPAIGQPHFFWQAGEISKEAWQTVGNDRIGSFGQGLRIVFLGLKKLFFKPAPTGFFFNQ